MAGSDFNINQIETWPLPVRLVSGLIVAGLICYASWAAMGEDLQNDLDSEIRTERSLRDQFAEKARQAANLEAYKEQIVELESLLDAQLRQLPNSNEVANLLDDISFIAQDNGLTLASIKWEPEVQKEIYTELPMNIHVTGTYEQLGSFAADTAALPRIVTIDKFDLSRVDTKGKDGKVVDTELLDMKLIAKTFRYNENQAKQNQARRQRKEARN
ncbi:type 4a pilus biogenesis protein PilO [Succinimonas amylolytica]|uniref:type 4a pilus biogenesis protein PilO n=1 Tax=Succinimonas amylolytica TaxID=83769 RepID=UPI000365CA43|nr:type 4a pilus biogenesis protein PilO [Succinimonas amylolytica]